MRRGHAHLIAMLAAFALVLAGCGRAPEQADTPTDAAPVETSTSDELKGIDATSRVVACSRSIGELWLLAGGELVGVTDDARDLTGLADDIASVGTISRTSLEQVLALEPDLVMLNDDLGSQRELHGSLDAAGIPVLVVDIDSFDDYADMMGRLTRATGREDLYARNVEAVRDGIDEVKEGFDCASGMSYLALRTSATKNKALKHDYFACAMLDELGLQNIADDNGALDDLSLEAIVAADPTWVFVIYQGEDSEAQAAFVEAFESSPTWGGLTAAQEGRVMVLPKDLFQYKPNARWAEAYEYLARVLSGRA